MKRVVGMHDGEVVRLAEPLGAPAGTRLAVTVLEESGARLFPSRTIDEVAGCLWREGWPKTLEELENGIEKGAMEAWENQELTDTLPAISLAPLRSDQGG